MALLADTHFPSATDKIRVRYNNRRNCPTDELKDKYRDWISPQLIREALDGFEKKKSPGPDNIKPLVFEHLPEEFIQALELAYKACIHLGYTPKLWKETKVIYIAKPGKEDYSQPKSFRPISLSNYLLKGLERLVVWNMDKALIDYPIHHKQHGFQTGKSTESAISNTTNYIEKFIMKKQHCVGVFLDISSAFDSIKPNHVRRALLDHGGHPEMVQWYHNYMIHRDIQVEMHGETLYFSTGIGLPQGGVCSAKFWLIAFDFAIKIINTYNIEGNGYADDCSALYGGPRLDHAISRLQKMLDSLTAWGKRCGLRFNPEKSVAVVFSRRRKLPPRALQIDGKDIPYKQEAKYLGVTLDSKLLWNTHINDKIAKAKKFIYNVANITRRNWGPKPKLMRWAYLGMVRPMVCYGSMIWGHRAPHAEAKFRRLNRMAINTFCTFPRSTPTKALEIMLDVMPLHLFCQQEGIAARARLYDTVHLDWDGVNQKKTHSVSHLRALQNQLEQIGLDPSHSDACSRLVWDQRFHINRDSFDGTAKHRTLSQYNVFTDGSRVSDRTGAGHIIYKGKRMITAASDRLPDGSTVFQAEVAAISKAAETLLSLRTDNIKFVKFFVDSQAALLALRNPMVRSLTVKQAIENLNKLSKRATRVTLCWIPAHAGHFGNSEADDLAKEGTIKTRISIKIGQPTSLIKSRIRKYITNLWRSDWEQYPQATHTKLFYDAPDPQKAKTAYELTRPDLGRLIRIITCLLYTSPSPRDRQKSRMPSSA